MNASDHVATSMGVPDLSLHRLSREADLAALKAPFSCIARSSQQETPGAVYSYVARKTRDVFISYSDTDNTSEDPKEE